MGLEAFALSLPATAQSCTCCIRTIVRCMPGSRQGSSPRPGQSYIAYHRAQAFDMSF